MYTKAFLLCFIKTWERLKKKKVGEIGKYKLNEIAALNVKKKKKKPK